MPMGVVWSLQRSDGASDHRHVADEQKVRRFLGECRDPANTLFDVVPVSVQDAMERVVSRARMGEAGKK